MTAAQSAGNGILALCQLVGLFSADLGCGQARAAFILRNLFRELAQHVADAKGDAKLPLSVCWVGQVGDAQARNDFYRVEWPELENYFLTWATGAGREFVTAQGMLGDGYIESDAAVFFETGALVELARTVGVAWPLQQVGAGSVAAVAPLADESKRLGPDQRRVMAARLALIREIERLTQTRSQQQAILALVDQANRGVLPGRLRAHLEHANDRPGEDRLLSERSLKRWLSAYRRHGEAGLAPGRRQSDNQVPAWGVPFLEHYWAAGDTTIRAAYLSFVAIYKGESPSEPQVRSFLRKLPRRA